MINKIIEFSAHNRFLILFLSAFIAYMGWQAFIKTPVDAIPDLSDTQVIVYSKWNVSPDIIEDQVTYPIITSLLGVPKIKDIRGISTFGNSFVYVLFQDGTDIYWARSRVMEYLSKIIPSLPDDVKTEIGPDATGVGWVYQYALKDVSGNNSLSDLRSFQDWFLRYQIQSVKGVSEVASIGGFEKQYQVAIQPNALRAFNLTLKDAINAIREGNNEVGARIIEFAGTEYMVRARGYIKSIFDIENIVVGTNKTGTPIFIKNIAKVSIGPQLRRGVSDLNGLGDTVGGIVVMRSGENANNVIQRVKEKIESLKPSLPKGVELVEVYDRSDLIKRAIQTLTDTLRFELLIVALVILIFLLHAPSAFVPIITLPIAVLISFIPMYLMGVSANIMSLGGIAIAIGAMVDASLVVVENTYKKLEFLKPGDSRKKIINVIIDSIKEVGQSSFYSLLVIAISFLPIFALEEQEGKLFKPLAYTKTLAMVVAAFVSITIVPALLVLVHHRKKIQFKSVKITKLINNLISPDFKSEDNHPISKFLFKIYTPVIHWVTKHPKKIIILSFFALIITIPVFFKLGSEFMPTLNEGSILYMPTTMPGISINEAQNLLQKQDEILSSFPQVKSVFGKVGRAETSTDPAPLSMVETTIVFKNQSEWPKVNRWYSFLPDFTKFLFTWFLPEQHSWEELISEMDEKMKFPGTINAWTMPIKGRIDMLTTGIRTPVGIKIYGRDQKEIENIGIKLEGTLKNVKGTRSVFSERISGGYFLDFDFNRSILARYGISIKNAHDTIRHAIGGANITTAIEGRDRYSINIRYVRAFRENISDLERVLLSTFDGKNIPLKEVATISRKSGPGMIRTENGLLVGYVYLDVNDSDIGGFVERAKLAVGKEITLPPAYSLEWSGQFTSMIRVKEKLKFILPITLLIVFLLIFKNTGSLTETSIILLAIPFSAIGAVWLLYFLGYNMSIAVWVGLIALLGVDAETAIFMLLYLNLAYKRKIKDSSMNTIDDLKDAIHEGAVKRIRPKMMTVMTTFIALLPILLAPTTNAGADVMKRMAAPMIGGIFSSFMLELLVYPAIYFLWKGKHLKRT